MLAGSKEKIDALASSGLTRLEARVLLVLLSLGEASAATISKIAEIDRSNVYKTIQNLEKLELVEKQVYPGRNVYNAVPLPIAVSILIGTKKQQHKNELDNLEKNLKEFRAGFQNHPNRKGLEQKEYLKILPSSMVLFDKKLESLLRNTKHNVDEITTESPEPRTSHAHTYEDLLKHGVQARWIFDRSARDDNAFRCKVKSFQHLFRSPNITMKISYHCLKPYGILFDNKIALVAIDEVKPVKCSRFLLTNNSQILANFKEHFETIWRNAIPHPGKIEE